jgi:hypothetical protein
MGGLIGCNDPIALAATLPAKNNANMMIDTFIYRMSNS